MDAVAYIDPTVIQFLNDNLVPLRMQASDATYTGRYHVQWTPTLLLLDPDGTEQYRTLGFYPPQDLIPSLLLGMGKAKFNVADRAAAINYFERLLSDYPNSSMAPEALYLQGVSNYLQTKEVKSLTDLYDRMGAQYSTSPWFTRADPYKFLKG